LLLTEAAGYDFVIVETVGVGQSETEVAGMVDMFILMLLPGSGDELQGIKRGIVELADLMVVNKADGELLAQARRVQSDYGAALRMLAPIADGWRPRVELCSALTGEGIPALWKIIGEFRTAMQRNGYLEQRRNEQARQWIWKEVREALLERFSTSPQIIRLIPQCENGVLERRITAGQAAEQLLSAYFKK
jgi:LAO/AO transport system kinase